MFSTILLFMFIFSFPFSFLPASINSSRLAFLYLVIYLVFNVEYRKKVKLILLNKKVVMIFCMLFLITLYSILLPVFKETNDFTIVSTFFNQIFMLFAGIFMFSYLWEKNKNIPFEIIYCFIIQASIQMASLLNGNVRQFFDIFKRELAVEVGTGYGNIRALGISGSAFFGLGVGFAFCYVLYFYYWDRLPFGNDVTKILLLILLILGGQSAARSSIVGVVFGGAIYLVHLIKKRNKNKKQMGQKTLKHYLGLVFILMLLLIAIVFVSNYQNQEIMYSITTYANFIFQIFYNYQNSGQLTTSSTSKLFDEMYFPIGNETIVFGDGRYTTATGSYYMATDAGYMRNILFFGVVGLILLFIYQLMLFDWKNKSRLLLNLSLISVILVTHIKGEVLSFLIISQVILLLLFLESHFLVRKENENGINFNSYDNL